jgi:ankyrin repeat protein
MTTKTKEPTLFDACRIGDVERVSAYLAPPNNGTVKEADERKMTMLHHAAVGGHPRVVSALLARSDIDLDASDASGWAPLHYAANAGHSEAATLILDAGANTSAKDEYKRSALHVAVTSTSAQPSAKVATVRALLAGGVNPRLKTVAGMTAFEVAKANSAPQEILALFPEGADQTSSKAE